MFRRLKYPKGTYIHGKQTMFATDSSNQRILKYNLNPVLAQRILIKNIPGYEPYELREPSQAIFDKRSMGLIIADTHNRRLLHWLPDNSTKVLIQNIACNGLAITDAGSVYVSDVERHEVIQYGMLDQHKSVVAGGHGQGSRLNQLNHPAYIFVGPDDSLYVSDSWNNRVMKWSPGASKGVVVAGGQGKGRDRTQLNCPMGLIVDTSGTIYVADHWNDRVMRWRTNASCGERIAGDQYLPGDNASQLNGPEGVAFDSHGNLYVADSNNHRIQRFDIQTA